jgi:hypothetical protein
MFGRALAAGIAALVVMTFALGATVAPASAAHSHSKPRKIVCAPPLVPQNGDICIPCAAGTHYSSTTKMCVK